MGTIPPIVHVTAPDFDDLPTDFQRNLATMRELLPEHEFRLHDDQDIDDFCRIEFPDVHRTFFNRLPRQIMRVDLVRYLWMSRIGGLYFDLDIVLHRGWEPDSGVLLIEREWTYPPADDIPISVHNCVFASAPEHPLWAAVIEEISIRFAGRRSWPERLRSRVRRERGHHDPVFEITGPNGLSRTVSRLHEHNDLDGVRILPGATLYQHGRSSGARSDATFVHETAGSWRSR